MVREPLGYERLYDYQLVKEERVGFLFIVSGLYVCRDVCPIAMIKLTVPRLSGSVRHRMAMG